MKKAKDRFRQMSCNANINELNHLISSPGEWLG